MTVKTITPEQLLQKMKGKEKVVLLDVRNEEKYREFHIEGPRIENLHIQKGEIFNLEVVNENNIASLPKDKEIIVTCTTGNSATKCASILSERDYDVVVLEGGINAWKEILTDQD